MFSLEVYKKIGQNMYLFTGHSPFTASLTFMRENEIASESLNKEVSATTTPDLVAAKIPVRLYQVFKGNASFIRYNNTKSLWLIRRCRMYHNSYKCLQRARHI